ncbi:MAG: hypothetical protein QOF33_4520 [Thermomicrobiales bacterium]|jgi:hypothetical protein|nr:hypothetical protein [Thermomicrobiales bacterium]
MSKHGDASDRNAGRPMPSASFQLEARQVEDLRAMAGARGISQSQIVREALDIAFQTWCVGYAPTDDDARDEHRDQVVPFRHSRGARLLPVGLPRRARRAAAHPEEADANPHGLGSEPLQSL